jgi:cell division protein FtsA
MFLNDDGKKNPKIIATGLSESKGLRHGYIINTEEVSESVSIAIRKAEKICGYKITKAFISMGGMGLSTTTTVGQVIISKADLEITDLDMEKLNSVAESEIPQSQIQNRKILHTIPLSYKIDGKAIFGNNPVGMKGSKLEQKTLYVTCLEPHFNDLVYAVEKAGITVLDVFASPIVSGTVILNKSQRIAGCVLANIGAETISIVVYENNIPISLEVFPIGGNDITNDIALGLRVSIEEAESIKLGAMTHTNVSKKKLDEIIQARLYDMFELIEAHLKKIGRSGLLPAGIFITGGSSNIGTIEDLAKASLRLPSRMASIGLNEKGKIIDSTWSVAYGLCIVGFSNNDNQLFGEGSFDILKFPKNAVKWFKQFLP